MSTIYATPSSTVNTHTEAFDTIARGAGLMPAPVVVLIPVYKPQRSLISLAQQIRMAAAPHEIVVVDDGSTSSATPGEAREFTEIFAALEDSGARVIRYTPNRGKGAALKLGLQTIRESFPDAAVITADADGQHTPHDIARIAAELRENSMAADPQPIVLGIRRFDKVTPLRSRIGNWISSALFFLSTGTRLRDTQTGLRGIPAEHIEAMLDVPGERYEYEQSALLTSVRAGVELSTMEIETVYENNNEASHFRPIRDSFRVVAPMLGFGLSSFSSFLVDTALFLVFSGVIGSAWLALAGARVISGGMNFATNRWLVFGANRDPWWKALRDYAMLSGSILLAGMVLVQAFTVVGMSLVIAKLVTDASLFFVGYAVQAGWARKKEPRI